MYTATTDPASGGRPASGPSSGIVIPAKTALGTDYPAFLRTQQVGMGVVKGVATRLSEALAGGPIRLHRAVLGEAEKVIARRHIMEVLFHELYADPIPAAVVAKRQIASVKARSLIDDRLETLFALDRLDIPGLSLDKADLYELLALVVEHVMGGGPVYPLNVWVLERTPWE